MFTDGSFIFVMSVLHWGVPLVIVPMSYHYRHYVPSTIVVTIKLLKTHISNY